MFVLFISINDDRFGPKIAGHDPYGIQFPSEEAADAYAEQLAKGARFESTEELQDQLGGTEYFHVYELKTMDAPDTGEGAEF